MHDEHRHDAPHNWKHIITSNPESLRVNNSFHLIASAATIARTHDAKISLALIHSSRFFAEKFWKYFVHYSIIIFSTKLCFYVCMLLCFDCWLKFEPIFWWHNLRRIVLILQIFVNLKCLLVLADRIDFVYK